MSGGAAGMTLLFTFGAIIGSYFAPLIIAVCRGHLSVAAICVVNLVFGWTVLGWIAALIWSLTGNTRDNLLRAHGHAPAA